MRYVPAAEWKLLPPTSESPNGVPVDVVYVHHDTAPLLADPLATIRQHQRDHIVNKGWRDLAYQEWIANNGDVYEGRGFRVRDGATGCQGGVSLSICLQGNFEAVVPTRAQLDSLVTRIVAAARQGLLAPGFKILAHQDAPPCRASWTSNTNATACCGKHLIAELPAVRERVAAALAPDPEPEDLTVAEIERLEKLLRCDAFRSGGSQWARTPDLRNVFPADGPTYGELKRAGRLNPEVELTDAERKRNWETYGGPRGWNGK